MNWALKRQLWVIAVVLACNVQQNSFAQTPMAPLPQLDVFAFNQPPSTHARQVFNEITRALNVPMGEIELAANPYVPNAMATAKQIVMPSPYWGYPPTVIVKKIVLYNPAFMTQMEITTGSKWAGISIIAHELGHHINDHVTPQNPWDAMRHPWQKELEADYFSGKALAKMGASPTELQRAQRQMFSMWGSPTHPDTVARIQRINSGWKDGGGSGNVDTDLMSIWTSIQADLTKWWQ